MKNIVVMQYQYCPAPNPSLWSFDPYGLAHDPKAPIGFSVPDQLLPFWRIDSFPSKSRSSTAAIPRSGMCHRGQICRVGREGGGIRIPPSCHGTFFSNRPTPQKGPPTTFHLPAEISEHWVLVTLSIWDGSHHWQSQWKLYVADNVPKHKIRP